MQGVPSAESSRSVRGLGKGVSGKPYPRLCNARRPRLEPGTFRLQAVLCHVLPSLKLRREGLDGHEKLKGYIWWLSLCFATVAAFTVSCYSLQYSVYAASYRVKHIIITSLLLVLGAMSMTWICDTITESGFGHGSSLIICVGILTGYTDTLHKLITQFSGNYPETTLTYLQLWPLEFL